MASHAPCIMQRHASNSLAGVSGIEVFCDKCRITHMPWCAGGMDVQAARHSGADPQLGQRDR